MDWKAFLKRWRTISIDSNCYYDCQCTINSRVFIFSCRIVCSNSIDWIWRVMDSIV